MTSLAPIHYYSWVSGGYLTNCNRDFMKSENVNFC